jgi:hypothetical protein
MIPQAIASCGPHADLWAQLKAMIHAIRRAKNATTSGDLTPLDRERLEEVISLIKSEVHPGATDNEAQLNSLITTSDRDASNAFGADLHKLLRENTTFERWNASQKIGTDKKLQKLQSAVQKYLQNPSNNLINSPPKEELTVIEAILESLLSQTESALQV